MTALLPQKVELPKWAWFGMMIALTLVLSLGLAWISTNFYSLQGWFSFYAALLIGIGALLGCWLLVRPDYQHNFDWVVWLVFGAALLRLIVGILWFVSLPRWGYGSESELAGYVMSDAYSRDVAAWELSQADAPLLSAFQEFRSADQYGGLLFFSAFVYRYLGGDVHQPLLIVVLTSAFSALAVLFAWEFARRVWGEGVARIAAWVIVLYPEAVLLGSSQMREAFTMTLTAAVFYGLVHYWRERTWVGWLWILGALLLCLPLSSLFAIFLITALIIAALALDQGRLVRNWRVWMIFVALLLLGLAVLWIFGQRISPDSSTNPLTLIRLWLRQSARWQAYITQHASGWVDKILNSTPEWMHVYLIVAYGAVRPFFPAALFATGAPLWRIIAIWRSIGWAIVLMFLAYVPIRIIKTKKWWTLTNALNCIVWIGILISSYRGGGDQHDNPRYRVAFISLQAVLVAWVWFEHRQRADPWLRRIFIGVGWIIFWFVPWYLRRYTPLSWPIQNVFATLGLGFASALLYWLWDWARVERAKKKD